MSDEGRRVLRYEVPVNDCWHTVTMYRTASILHVAARRPDVVEFWAEDDGFASHLSRAFRVFGTGQGGIDGVWRGTALAAGGALVWHLFELPPSAAAGLEKP